MEVEDQDTIFNASSKVRSASYEPCEPLKASLIDNQANFLKTHFDGRRRVAWWLSG